MNKELKVIAQPFINHVQGVDNNEPTKMVALKEWAFSEGYCITTIRVPKEKNRGKYKYYLQLTQNYKNKLLRDFHGHTEYHAVVHCCEWIIEKNHRDVGGL